MCIKQYQKKWPMVAYLLLNPKLFKTLILYIVGKNLSDGYHFITHPLYESGHPCKHWLTFTNKQLQIFCFQYLKADYEQRKEMDPENAVPPYHYSSHYSNSGTVLHFLVRLPPFTSMFLKYQGKVSHLCLFISGNCYLRRQQ